MNENSDIMPAAKDDGAETPVVNSNNDPLGDVNANGWVEKALSKPHPNLTKSAKTLLDGLRSDVDLIRSSQEMPSVRFDWRWRQGPDQGNLPRCIVKCETQSYTINSVLRLVLAARWSIELPDGLREAALARYLEAPDGYEQVIGDLLPADFRDEAQAVAARNKFDEGKHFTARDDWSVYLQGLENRRSGELLGLSTGLARLDASLRGLRGLMFLGGAPGLGKTSLAMFMAVNALRNHSNLGVLVYSLDMAKTVLFDRMLCLEAGVEYRDLLTDTVSPTLQSKLDAASKCLGENVLPRLRIVDRLSVGANENVADIIQRDINALFGLGTIDEVLIIIDYFQLLPNNASISSGLDADFERVRTLQRVQEWTRSPDRPAGSPILAISEVRKGESGRSELAIGDLMGSARLGYSAESILLLEPKDEGETGSVVPVRLKIAKGRDGAMRTSIDLLFEHTKSSFREAPQTQKGGKAAKAGATKKGESKLDPLDGMDA